MSAHARLLRNLVVALAGLAGVAAMPAVYAQTLTINRDTPGCAWTTTSSGSHEIGNYVCGPSTPQPGTIQFTASTFPAKDRGTTGNFIAVSRVGGTSGAQSGVVAANGGGCTVNGGGTVSFPNGVGGTQTVSVTTPSAPASCSFSLSGNAGALLGVPSTATLPVVDPATPGSIVFSNAVVTAVESGLPVSMGLARTGSGSQAAAVEVAIKQGASSAVLGTHFNLSGLTAPGTGSCPTTSVIPGNLGCVTFAQGALAPTSDATITALSNQGPAPTLTFNAVIVQPSTVTLGPQSTLSVNIDDPPPVVPENCTLTDAPVQLGGNPPPPIVSLAATRIMSFRINHSLLDGRLVGVYQPTAGMTIAISNLPCELGGETLGAIGPPAVSGCYMTLPGNNPTQVMLRVSTVNGYMTCAKPAPSSSGHLYVNVSWESYSNFGQPVRNACIQNGHSTCVFQFRRDA